jgi:hypothetical protein
MEVGIALEHLPAPSALLRDGLGLGLVEGGGRGGSDGEHEGSFLATGVRVTRRRYTRNMKLANVF